MSTTLDTAPRTDEPHITPIDEVPENNAASVRANWLKRALGGDHQSAFKLGKAHAASAETDEDLDAARRWLSYAETLGNEAAGAELIAVNDRLRDASSLNSD